MLFLEALLSSPFSHSEVNLFMHSRSEGNVDVLGEKGFTSLNVYYFVITLIYDA